MKNFILYLLGLFYALAIGVHPLHASIEIRSRQLTTVNGLSDNTIRHIYQDNKGFLWIGTLNGLNRYDGNTFVKYYPKDAFVSLSDRRIKQILEDQNGHLWIKTFSESFSCYNLKDDCFIDYLGDKNDQSHYKEILIQKDNIWLWGNSDGFIRITYKEGRFISQFFNTQAGTLPTNNILSISQGNKDDVYISTDKGLYHWVQNTLIQLSQKPFSKHLFYQEHAVFITSDGEIWMDYQGEFKKAGKVPVSQQGSISDALNIKHNCLIFTTSGSYCFDMKTCQVKNASSIYHIPNGIVSKDNKNNYWVQNGTGNLQYIHSESGETKIFSLLPKDNRLLLRREQYHVLHDSRGIIWITTFGNGVFVYTPLTQELQQFITKDGDSSPLASNFVQNIMEDRSGNIWIGTEHCGISHIKVINEGSQRIIPPKSDSKIVRMIKPLRNGKICIGIRNGGYYMYNSDLSSLKEGNPNSFSIYALAEDTAGKEWIGTRENGLLYHGKQYRMSEKPDSLSSDAIFSILKDRKGRMWIGTFGGWLNLAVPGKDKLKFKKITTNGYGQRWIRCLIEDKNGWIWAGTSGGVLVFHPDSILENPNLYYSYNRSNKSLKSDEIRSLMQDSKGRIWIAESGEGFSICTPNNNYDKLSFKHYNISNGLVNSKVQAFAEDKENMIWISTEYGISRFAPEEESFESYFFSSNILGNVYCDNCAMTLSDGRLAFGSNQGLVIINPQGIEKNDQLPNITFTDLKINGISVHPKDTDSPLQNTLPYTTSIRLKHNQNSFAVEFSTLNYPDSNSPHFSYILKNYEKEWSIPSALNFAAYKNLPSGNYQLHVKVCNATGLLEKHEAILNITIAPPFWATLQAIIIYLLLLGIIIYIIIRIVTRMNTLKNKIAVEKQLTEYKLVFFTNISHEFRTPLTLIQGALEKMSRIKNLPYEAGRPLQSMEKSSRRMLRLVNQLLEFRKMQNNKLSLQLENTDIVAFLHERFLDFNEMAIEKDIEYSFSSSLTSYKMYIDREKIDKIIYNLLSNAFKYTSNKGKITLELSLRETDGKFCFYVSDTGIGIPKNKRKDLFKRFMQSNFSSDSIGIGLHLSYELTLCHKGNLSYKENEGTGSIFTVCLPIDSSIFAEKDFLPATVPCIKDNESEHWELNAFQSLPTPINKRKILIIEDDKDIRKLLQEELGLYFETETAVDGNDGLDKAHTDEYELIVCDVLMPGLTGFEITRKLKNNFKTSHIPIILLTALSSPENQLEGIENGADAYISKPFSIKYLLTRIYKLIEQRDKLREKFSKTPETQHETMCFTQKDKDFFTRMTTILEENMGRSDFSIEEFASLMRISKTGFYSKVKGVTGLSPVEYLRVVRLKKATELLTANKEITITEVAYRLGFNDPLYFSRCFKQQFGVSPSNYQKGEM